MVMIFYDFFLFCNVNVPSIHAFLTQTLRNLWDAFVSAGLKGKVFNFIFYYLSLFETFHLRNKPPEKKKDGCVARGTHGSFFKRKE